MSRKWERMVYKNSKKTNQQRKKQGIRSVPSSIEENEDWFKGRNMILPSLLTAFAVFFSIIFWGIPGERNLYWVTVFSYLLLAVFLFLKRPYLRVGKNFVSSRRFAVDKRLESGDIKGILVQPGYVVIERKTGGMNWVFSRLIHRYDTAQMADRLKEFAKANSIPFEERSK